MKINQACTLLGHRSPHDFMRRYWQRKPLLIRQAIPAFTPPLTIAAVKKLARRDDVQSRLIWRHDAHWQIKQGPITRLPKDNTPGWTLLVQGVDLYSDAAAALLQAFRFIPDARLDDLMISIASAGGGVGPHCDSYDVFLLQAAGQRQWRYGPAKDRSILPNRALRILRHFEPSHEAVLNPGDMLYLPPQIAHDGVALGQGCMTISIGFRAPTHAQLAHGLLEAAADQVMARIGVSAGPYADPALPGASLRKRYRDPGQVAVKRPAALPDTLIHATLNSIKTLRFDAALAARFLGCWLSEPSNFSVFEAPTETKINLQSDWPNQGKLVLDRRSRMLYRGKQLFINGETALLPTNKALRTLANARAIACADPACRHLSKAARACLTQWLRAGWLHYIA
jgi:50S ribosomal protein L16 3-hydroxylase